MSVPKGKRKPSQFEVFHHLANLRKDITDLLLRDFGHNSEKAKEKLSRRFGGKDYGDLSDVDKTLYDRILQKHESFESWFILGEREIVVDCLRKIGEHVYTANSIYPTCALEAEERRLHQDLAIGQCYRLVQELQYTIETLPVDVNAYLRFSAQIQKEIDLIKGWRKSDNKFKRVISAPPPTSPM